jgi:hypothetical protein
MDGSTQEKQKLDPRVERLLLLILQTLREYGAAPAHTGDNTRVKAAKAG